MLHADTNPPQHPCPTRADWEDFLHGRQSLDRHERLADHLEACPACAAILPTLDLNDDELVFHIKFEDAVKFVVSQPTSVPGNAGRDFTKEPACAAAMRRLRHLILLEGTPEPPGEPS